MKINDPFLSLAMDVRLERGKVWCVTLAPSYIRGFGTKRGFFIGEEKGERVLSKLICVISSPCHISLLVRC
jgi:hypothetical protein